MTPDPTRRVSALTFIYLASDFSRAGSLARVDAYVLMRKMIVGFKKKKVTDW